MDRLNAFDDGRQEARDGYELLVAQAKSAAEIYVQHLSPQPKTQEHADALSYAYFVGLLHGVRALIDKETT